MPVYWGNRNWHPLPCRHHAADADDGIKRALGFVTSAYSSYSGCRQYREDIARAQAEVGEGAPEIAKLPAFSAHPRFIASMPKMLNGAVPILLASACRVSPLTACRLRWREPAGMSMQLKDHGSPRCSATRIDGLEARVSEPQRAANSALAGARYQRSHSVRSSGRTPRAGNRSHWFHLRSHGSAVRFRHRSRGALRRTRNPYGSSTAPRARTPSSFD